MNERQYRVISAGDSAVIFARALKNAPVRVTEAAKRLEATLDERKRLTCSSAVRRTSAGRPIYR
jgi:hypothetical protein